jgi:hypothetical protein
MYKCTECGSIPGHKPDYNSRYNNDQTDYKYSCMFCGSPATNIKSIKNTNIEVSSINYLFPPLEWPNHRDRFLGYLVSNLNRYYYSNHLDGYVLQYTETTQRGYPSTVVSGIRRALQYHNWQFNIKVMYLMEHPEYRGRQNRLNPTNNIPCLLNNSFYAYLEQDYLLDIIFTNTLNQPRIMLAEAKNCIWTLGEPKLDLAEYLEIYQRINNENISY